MHRLWQRIAQHFVPSEKNSYRPHVLRRPWLVFFIAVSLVAEGFLVANLAVRQTGENYLAAVEPGEVIALTNSERVQNNLSGVTENALLDAAALAKARDMAAKGYFAHVSPDGTEPWAWISNAGYAYTYAGENLAVRFTDSKQVVDAWMASPSHRANIVKPVYTDIGVGVAEGEYQGQQVEFVVQYFGSPKIISEIASSSLPATSTLTIVQKTAPTKIAQRGVVKAAEVVPHIPAPTAQSDANSLLQSTQRQVVRSVGDARPVTQGILASVVVILLIALSLTFFMHIQIQPVGMLMSGAFIALFAFSCMTLNATFFKGSAAQNLTAAVVQSDADDLQGPAIAEDGAQVENVDTP